MSKESRHPEPWEEALEASARRPKSKISRLHLAVYLAYGGDGEAYANRNKLDPIMFSGAWAIIDSLLQKMSVLSSGLGSEKYRREVEAELAERTEDGETRELLWSVSWFRDIYHRGAK